MLHEAACYVFAITEADPAVDLKGLAGITPVGAPAGEPEVLGQDALAAIYSPMLGERIRPDRRNLAAHQKVLSSLMASRVPMLPVAFGLVAPSRRDLRELLRLNHAELCEEMERVGNKVEFGLELSLEVGNIFEYFVDSRPLLREHRDRIMGLPDGASREEKIELGRSFQRLLDEAREQALEIARQALGASVLAIHSSLPRKEKDLLDLACLIPRDGERDFHEAVERVADRFDDDHRLGLSGPWPPSHFVRVRLESIPGSD